MEEIEARLAAWHAQRYPAGVNLERTCIKLQEEAGEVARHLLRGEHAEVIEEIADTAIVLCHLLRGIRPGLSLAAAMADKLAVIEGREGQGK